MPFLIFLLVILLLIGLGVLFWYALPFILILGLAGWLYYVFTKPKRQAKTKTYVIYMDPFQPQNGLRPPREDSIDVEYTESDAESDGEESHD